jgi:hypothetical protein
MVDPLETTASRAINDRWSLHYKVDDRSANVAIGGAATGLGSD